MRKTVTWVAVVLFGAAALGAAEDGGVRGAPALPGGDGGAMGHRALPGGAERRPNARRLAQRFAAVKPGAERRLPDGVVTLPFGDLPGGRAAHVFRLHGAGGIVADFTDFGARLVRLYAPDRFGNLADVAAGADSADGLPRLLGPADGLWRLDEVVRRPRGTGLRFVRDAGTGGVLRVTHWIMADNVWRVEREGAAAAPDAAFNLRGAGECPATALTLSVFGASGGEPLVCGDRDWTLSGPTGALVRAARLADVVSGRTLELWTTARAVKGRLGGPGEWGRGKGGRALPEDGCYAFAPVDGPASAPVREYRFSAGARAQDGLDAPAAGAPDAYVVTQAVRLAQMRAEVKRAKLKVGYPGKFLQPTAEQLKWKLPELALVERKLVFADGRYDVGEESVGFVEASAPSAPALFVGESLAELANERPEDFEQTTEMRETAPGRWRSAVPLALRYFRFKGAAPAAVKFLEQTDPALVNRGAFACGDARLERMWAGACRTLRLCARHFLVDGVKRDRLPWSGDLMVSMLSNCYTFRDAEIVRRTMTVLDSAGPEGGDVNGIVDYSLWLVIAHDAYQLHFADRPFLARNYGSLARRLEGFAKRTDARGLINDPGEWLFIDWTPEAKSVTALNMIYHGALLAGARLADRMGRADDAARCRARAAAVKAELRRGCDPRTGLYGDVRYPNLYAVVFGVAEPGEESRRIADALAAGKMPPVGTPYVAYFETRALVMGGRADAALANVRRIWGGMLDRGATTFWEGWSPEKQGDAVYEFYGRPFANSLCHAWSSSPAFFFARDLAGIRPTSDGWATYEVKPLKEAAGMTFTVPTPKGALEVAVNGEGKATVRER